MRTSMKRLSALILALAAAALLYVAPVAARPKDPDGFQYTARACASSQGTGDVWIAACRPIPSGGSTASR